MEKKPFDPKSHLLKHGWEDGSGLGKNEHGIKEAIKAKIKADKTGLGHNPGDEFTFHWWDHMFNKAANNIQVENSQEGVTVKKGDQALELCTKKGLTKTLANNKDLLYGRFVKAATLTDNGVEVQETPVNSDSDSDDSADEDIGSLSKVSDEMLMKVCGGRTAHKAARHGLGLSGKLSRVAEQDQAFVNTASPTVSDGEKGAAEEVSPKKHKRSKREKRKEGSEEGGEHKSKKAKKRKRDRDEESEVVEDAEPAKVVQDLSPDSDVIEDDTAEVPKKKSKKKKKKRDRDCDSMAEQSSIAVVGETETPKGEQELSSDSGVIDDDTAEVPKKKSKKKKRKREQDCDSLVEQGSTTLDESAKKSKSKKKKKQKLND